MDNNNKNPLDSYEYKYGFTTDIETDQAPLGLSEDIIRTVSYTHLTLPTTA